MALQPAIQALPREIGPRAEKSLAPLITPLLGPFIIAAVTVAALEDWNYVVKGLGVLLALVYIVFALRDKTWPSQEVAFFSAWLTWCLTGAFVSVAGILFQVGWTTTFQILVLLAIISGLTSTKRALSINLFCFLLAAAIVAGFSLVTGEYSRTPQSGVVERVAGLAVNPNQFGWIMILATVVMAYFWMTPSRFSRLKHVVLFCGFSAAAVATVFSGSRKAILGLGVFFFFWLWFCYRKQVFRRPVMMVSVVAFGVIGVALLALIRELPVATRFQESWEGLTSGTEGGGMNRLTLIHMAWQAFVANPIFGLGLNNFVVYSRGAAAHAEYGEILADTGMLGFILYFSIYVAMWIRAGKIRRYCPDPFAVNVAGLIRTFLVVSMVLAWGRFNFTDKPFWILMGCFAGYTTAVWRYWRPKLSSKQAAPLGPSPLRPQRMVGPVYFQPPSGRSGGILR
jgi:O-antigen ligase